MMRAMEKNTIQVNDNATIELNEEGNVTKITETKQLSDIVGTFSHTFYYRIEKEAGLSTDDTTGEQFPVYCQKYIEYENEMTEDTLHYAHHVHYRNQISTENDINIEYITPITKEAYEKAMN